MALHEHAAHRLGDPGEAIGEVRAAPAPHVDALASLASKNAEPVVFDFMQPPGSGGRMIDERGLARADEAERRIASPAGRWGAPG